MMKNRDIILAIINKEFRTEPSDDSLIKLEERETQKPYDFYIKAIPKDSIAIKADSFKKRCSRFKHKTNWRCADYVIVVESKKKVLYIELKWSKGKNRKLIEQFIGAKRLINECKKIVVKGSEQEKTLNLVDYQSYFVAVTNIFDLRYRRSRIDRRRKEKHDKPKKYMKVSGGKPIYFNEIARCSTHSCCSSAPRG